MAHNHPPVRRVLMVDTGSSWRGGQRQLVLLAVGLRARGWEPLVVGQPRAPLLQELKRVGIATAALTVRSRLDLLAIRRLRRLIATWKPAVTHAHDPRGQSVLGTALWGRTTRVPLVVTRRLATPPRGLMARAPRVDRFIAITAAVQNGLRAAGVDDARIALVHPGIGVPDATVRRDWRTECGWSADTIVAGVVGPLTESGHRHALGALLRGADDATRRALGVVLLGGPAAGRMDLAGVRAYRAGFVHDVTGALAGLDLLLHPGGAEGLGTAVVEAMALRVPTLGFAAGGIGEIIESGRNGLLVPAGDASGFAGALNELATAPERRRALGEAGPARAEAFSTAKMVDRTEAIYRDLIERLTV